MMENHFGRGIAEHYDETSADEFAPQIVGPAVDFLARLAPGGRALEFGIGTGRIALPLSERSLAVHGIDLSDEMLTVVRAKPGADRIGLTLGDFATARVEGPFALAYLVFNTVMNLTTQQAQVACFENAAAHLAADGCFVVEVAVPDLQRLPHGERFRMFDLSESRLDVDEYDIAGQGLISHHYRRVGGKLERWSVPFRYVWPAELDLMAQIAGMRLRERWADWDRAPFTSESPKHVSVWEKVR